jgi:hypothetical protein
MRRLIGIVALLLLLGAVFFVLRQPSRSGLDEASPSTTTSTVGGDAAVTSGGDDTSTDASTTTEAQDSAESTTSAAATTEVTDTTMPDEVTAEFAVTEIQFDEDGFIAIKNVGPVAGNIGGYALCSRPNYFQLPDLELQPLGIVWLALGDGGALGDGAGIAEAVIPMNGQLGTLRQADGELGLYRGSSFGDPELIVTYVEWGSAGHGRADVAIEAGIWEPDTFLQVPADAFGIQSIAPGRPATSPDDWTAGVGG